MKVKKLRVTWVDREKRRGDEREGERFDEEKAKGN